MKAAFEGMFEAESKSQAQGSTEGFFCFLSSDRMLQDAIKHALSTYDAGTVELDWHTADGEPTIRVRWYEPTCKGGEWTISEEQATFPFTAAGFEQAADFAYSL